MPNECGGFAADCCNIEQGIARSTLSIHQANRAKVDRPLRGRWQIKAAVSAAILKISSKGLLDPP